MVIDLVEDLVEGLVVDLVVGLFVDLGEVLIISVGFLTVVGFLVVVLVTVDFSVVHVRMLVFVLVLVLNHPVFMSL